MLCTCLAVTSHYFLMRNEIFDGIGEKLLQTKAVPIALLHLSIICWSLSKNYPVRSSRSKSTTRLQPARGKRVCQDLNQTAQQLHMAARKSLETMIDMILNWSQPKIAAKFVQMKCYGWKRCSDKRWQGKLWFSIWRFFKQSAFVNNHLLCYWPAIDNLISKICPKFQVLSSTFLRLMSCWMSSKVKKVHSNLCQMHWSKVCIQEFRYFVPGLDIQPEQSEKYNPALKKAVASCKTRQFIYHFFLKIDTIPWLSGQGEWNCLGLLWFDSLWMLKLSADPWHFAWHWARQCTDTSAF